MCGIIGYFAINGDDPDTVCFSEALDKMQYRGPDGRGVVEKKGQLVGHVRLGIIDLVGGSQPMEIDDHLITFNGEIYNFRELRESLIKDGVTFRTSSDTEVILAGYLQRGTEFFCELVGMFAFAIHLPDGSILLHRDQTGQKPLYYFRDKNRFAYSSVLNSLVHLVGPQDLSPEAIILYLYLSYVPTPFCIYENVGKVPPGWIIRIDRFGAKTSWESNTACNKGVTLNDVIEYSTVSDVPMALSLSGGIDSSIILKSIHSKIDIAYTVQSGGWKNGNDEWKLATKFAKSLNIQHCLIAVDELSSKSIGRIHEKMDEPFGDSSILMADLVASKARNDGIKVVLTGDGADEFFSGYRKHRALYFLSYIYKLPRICQKILLRFIPNKKMRKILSQSKNLSDAYLMTLNMGVENYELKKHATKIISSEFQINNSLLIDCFRNDRKIVLEGDMMVKSDRIFMQHGVESRPVFSLNIMTEILKHMKVGELISLRKMKRPLRALAIQLPGYLLNRKKTGFESPLKMLSLEEMDLEIRRSLDRYIKRLEISRKDLIVNIINKGLKSVDAREKYVVYIFSLWLKLNSKNIKWS